MVIVFDNKLDYYYYFIEPLRYLLVKETYPN
jgi:hypothetical protein